MKIFFLSFGSTNSYGKSLERIKKQAESMHVFEKIFIYTESTMPKEFTDSHKDFIESNPRGYGYWIWKPFLIHHVLKNEMVDGDILIYADCGCTLLPTGLARLFEYCISAINSKNGIIGFELSYPEKKYTKMDTIIGMNAEHLADTNQIMATEVILCKKTETTDIIKTWYDTCISNNYHYVDDSPSQIANSDIFVDNRHDQSIFSILMKLTDGTKIPGEETEIDSLKYPIRNSRLRE